MRKSSACLIAALMIAGSVRLLAAGPATMPAETPVRTAPSRMPTASDLIFLADRSTAELRQGIESADEAIKIVSINLASAKTTAYKRRDAYPHGNGETQIRINFDQGALQSTGSPLDVGISGSGMFCVRTADNVGTGRAFTRNGNFFITSSGELAVNLGDGYRLEPPIMLSKGINAELIQISEQGEIFTADHGSNVRTKVGQFQLTTFANPSALKQVGPFLFVDTDLSGDPISGNAGEFGRGKTLAGFLEASNVNVEQEKLRLRKLREWRKAMIEAAEEKK